jgi:hypothetical protein
LEHNGTEQLHALAALSQVKRAPDNWIEGWIEFSTGFDMVGEKMSAPAGN